jgi:hypothetical protein
MNRKERKEGLNTEDTERIERTEKKIYLDSLCVLYALRVLCVGSRSPFAFFASIRFGPLSCGTDGIG